MPRVYRSKKHPTGGKWPDLGNQLGRSGSRFQPSTFGELKDSKGGWADELPAPPKSAKSKKGKK